MLRCKDVVSRLPSVTTWGVRSRAAAAALAACAMNRALGMQIRAGQDALVDHLVHQRSIKSPRVESVMRMVDRKFFVDPRYESSAYIDRPLPIGQGQTISAPHMHATCLELLQGHLVPGARALDVGSGSGYLTACMALMVGPSGFVLGIDKVHQLAKRSVTSIQRANPELCLHAPAEGEQEGAGGAGGNVTPASDAARARPTPPGPGLDPGCTLMGTGLNWKICHGNARSDVLQGEEPFAAIHVGAAADEIPEVLLHVLKPGGRMVIPVGPQWSSQVLTVVDKDLRGHVDTREYMGVVYVPLTRPSEMEDGY